MKTDRTLALGVIAAAVITWTTGCNEPLWGPKEKSLTPQSQLGASDIPVPTGFDMNEAESEDKSAGGWRYIRHVYEGKEDPQLVRAFYRDQMPMSSSKWTLMSDEMQQGKYMLHFQNELETCDITVSRVKEGWTTKTKLMVEVSPRGRGSAVKRAPEKK